MREAIRALPDGVYRSEIWNNPLGEKLHYPLKLTVQGDAIELDFAGAPAQLPQGGLNCTYSYTAAHATYPMKCMLSPQVRSNAGCYRPFTVKAPEGSILNCTKPASVNLRTRVGWYIAPNIFRALADAAPAQVQAATGLPVAINIYGREANGHVYADHFFMGAGQGASRHGDGKSALLYPTSAANTSVELMEARAPVLVLEKSFVTDSGGAGEHRGGCGVRTRLRKLHDDGLPTLASVYPEGVGVTVQGLHGGLPGGSVRGVVLDPDGNVVHDCGTGELVTLTRTDRIVEVRLAGGAGFGDPRARPAALVEQDVAEGIVSPEAAATRLWVADRCGQGGGVTAAEQQRGGEGRAASPGPLPQPPPARGGGESFRATHERIGHPAPQRRASILASSNSRSLLLIAPLCVVGAIIGVQLIVTLGITANTSLIGALAGMALARIPLRRVHALSLGSRAEPGAERDLGRHLRRRQRADAADRHSLRARPPRPRAGAVRRRVPGDAARRLPAVSHVRFRGVPRHRRLAARCRRGRGDPRRRRRRPQGGDPGRRRHRRHRRQLADRARASCRRSAWRSSATSGR